ncbi:MAG: 1-acyl-sn-glycerol-3-phosphate acyltransferase [Pseudomonadota bacterium]
MTQTIELPLWLFLLIVVFAAVTALSHLLIPSVRWFFRLRLERAVKRLNARLKRPIEPFKLARRYDMIQRLIYDPEVTEEIVAFSKAKGVPENVAFETARTYAREIVPSFSAFAYFSFGIRAARLLATSVYRIETAKTNDAVIAGIPKQATVVFVMNHRSNMDYVLVTYLAARDISLSYAVGEWARVWPLSFLIKSLGAYFIRRRARDALYRRVLARYVQMATAGGVNQAFYPEGGLSLDGRMKHPKMGLLSYIVDGFHPEEGRDVIFVPVAINYDRVLEDVVLVAAHKRGDRRFGVRISVILRFILAKLWQRLTLQETRFGTAAVAFGTPLSLRDSLHDRSVPQLGTELMARIGDGMPVLAAPAMSTVLLQHGALAEEALRTKITALFKSLPEANRLSSLEVECADVTIALREFHKRGLIAETSGQWSIAPGKKELMQFYANSIVHLLETNAAPAS